MVLLVDVSGSMEGYADALLRFAHAASHRRSAGHGGAGPTEVFALGTRLTRITREMALRDPDAAMTAVATALVDAGGGTVDRLDGKAVLGEEQGMPANAATEVEHMLRTARL